MVRNLLLPFLVTLLQVAPVRAQLEPAGTGGLEALDLDLRRLGHVKRALVIGAHPDDEDTELLALLARGQGAQAAYLSLTRGEGGQNLIGEELGVLLGILRTEELAAARRLDGARQFFTRTYDFGYSKSAEETFGFWPRDSVLKDVVRVIRRFRPQVVVSIFRPGGGGHGQHQVAGIVAHEAFEAAADPDRFPELLEEEGLEPHAPAKLYRSARFSRDAATLTIESGRLDPVAGRSYHQIAMASRSQHRSQDMGRLQAPGPSQAHLELVADRTGEGARGLFAGIDTSVVGLASGAAAVRLARFAAWTDSARAALAPRAPDRVVPHLLRALEEARSAEMLVPSGERAVVREQVEIAERAVARAAGVVVDARVDDEALTPDQAATVRVLVWNAGARRVTLRNASAPRPGAGEPVEPGAVVERSVAVPRPAGLGPTRPYFLERPPAGALYDWRLVAPAVRGLPFEPSPYTVRVELAVDGVPIAIEREAVYRYADQAKGEVRRPIHDVPRIGVRLEPRLVVWPLGSKGPRAFRVTVTNFGKAPAEGTLSIEVPEGWPRPEPVSFRIEREDESRSFTAQVRAPGRLRAGDHRIAAVARTADGAVGRVGVVAVDYPHVRGRYTADSAVATARAVEIALPKLARIGYVRGAADRVPEALRAVGLDVELLDDDALRSGELRGLDAIVVGSRAYETNETLTKTNDRLLEYVRGGGTLVVQYQQYAFVRGGYAPYPLEIARPHDRVTDETAPPRLLEPDHPALTRPNAIGPADWTGWVQERGLYFPREWDGRYAPLVAFADPGEDPKRGAILVARVGKGVYVYSGLAFFRQLPAGVPGAYRLFLNLLALE